MALFKAFNLSNLMIDSLNRQGYIEPSKVQLETIPKVLQGMNLLVRSETGSGKTHAFLIPLINKLNNEKEQKLKTLIIVPTNELARQTFNFSKGFKKEFPDIKVRLISSETSEKENISGLKIQPQIIVGTPGRIVSLIKKGSIKYDSIETIVLDEADMLLELGYFNEIDFIMNVLNKPQVLIFSATIDVNLKSRITKYIGGDYEINLDKNKTSSKVTHYLVDIHNIDYKEATHKFIQIKNPYFLIIFASSKEKVNELYQYLKKFKYSIIMVTGNLSDRERKAALKRINNDEFQIIVASDLLSRGLDIKNISDVLSVDVPNDLTYYFHRSGRTGRFNKSGDSYLFFNRNEMEKVNSLIKKGVEFITYSLKNDELVQKEITFKKPHKKKESDELIKDIKKAKYESKSKQVKPNYKKKVNLAIDKVKRKHHREMIRKEIRKQRVERYKQEAKKNG